jgi:hypothetical protein
MSDLLTPTVNVPAEREKQRRIVNEMREAIAEREQLTRLHGVRGLRRIQDQGRNPCAPETHGQHRIAGVEGVRMAQSAGIE